MKPIALCVLCCCAGSFACTPVHYPPLPGTPLPRHRITGDPLAIRLDPSLPMVYARAARNAIEYWNCAVGADIIAEHPHDPNAVTIKESAALTESNRAMRKEKGVHLLGRYRRAHKEIILADELMAHDIDGIETVMRHEIGHALGLPHTAIVGWLMYPVAFTSLCKNCTHPLDAGASNIVALRLKYQVDVHQHKTYDCRRAK